MTLHKKKVRETSRERSVENPEQEGGGAAVLRNTAGPERLKVNLTVIFISTSSSVCLLGRSSLQSQYKVFVGDVSSSSIYVFRYLCLYQYVYGYVYRCAV